MPVKLGFVGAGAVAQMCHIANFVEIADCRAVALAELRPELGRAAAAKFGIPRVYSTHRELLADPEVDAVVVVTRQAATGAVVLDALRAGRHVLSEKPMAHTLDQARLLAAEAQARDLRYAVGFMKRHDAAVQYAHSLLERYRATGELGPLAFVRAYCFTGHDGRDGTGFVMTPEERTVGLQAWPTAPDWLPEELHAEYELFLNVNSHDLNLLRYLLDGTPTVTGADLSRPLGKHVALDFGNCGGILEFGNTSLGEWNEGVEVYFARGVLRIAFPAPFVRQAARVEISTDDGRAQSVLPSFNERWSFRRQAEAFVKDVATGAEPLAGGADGVADLALAEEIWRLHLQTMHRTRPPVLS
ncbi:MAG TPA: Gfo/Idh/MocA family oxidoreductase [Candidatus Binatia bacterium]|nr:Gfo/Idh/MocA family oxidoreductase [Candidatus Binatia bacterium]